MKEESHTVITTVSRWVELPDTPYALWARGELDRLLLIPDDGTRVEVISREIVVSPPATIRHEKIASSIHYAFWDTRNEDPAFPWWPLVNPSVSLLGGDCGVIPDLMILDKKVHDRADGPRYVGDETELVVEVTSPSNAHIDREPERSQTDETKWQWYARAEVPYYLLVDADPKVMQATLYSIPDQASAAYLQKESWAFGVPIRLPDPFGVEIPTTDWQPWSDGPG